MKNMKESRVQTTPRGEFPAAKGNKLSHSSVISTRDLNSQHNSHNIFEINKSTVLSQVGPWSFPKDSHDYVLEIMKFSTELLKKSSAELKQNIEVSQVIRRQNTLLCGELHELLNLYIKEEILKYYCCEAGWKVDKELIDKYVMPSVQLLSLNKSKLTTIFEPYLKELTHRYVLNGELDSYSRLSHRALFIEMTSVWLRAKQKEIALKKLIKAHRKSFLEQFCEKSGSCYTIDRQKLYQVLFGGSGDIKMTNLIKIFVFCYKVAGDAPDGDIEQWIRYY